MEHLFFHKKILCALVFLVAIVGQKMKMEISCTSIFQITESKENENLLGLLIT